MYKYFLCQRVTLSFIIYLLLVVYIVAVHHLVQGFIVLNRNGNSATFFSYVCNAKKFKELFYPGITANISFVSLTLIIVNAK